MLIRTRVAIDGEGFPLFLERAEVKERVDLRASANVCVNKQAIPHLNPLPLAKGRGRSAKIISNCFSTASRGALRETECQGFPLLLERGEGVGEESNRFTAVGKFENESLTLILSALRPVAIRGRG